MSSSTTLSFHDVPTQSALIIFSFSLMLMNATPKSQYWFYYSSLGKVHQQADIFFLCCFKCKFSDLPREAA